MAYTPINWQTGDTITAEKMNKMDNGWGVQNTQLFSETVTTVAGKFGNEAELTYSTPIKTDSITVMFNGNSYICPAISIPSEDAFGFGGVDSEWNYDFTQYPFAIVSAHDNTFATQTEGTYTISVNADSLEVSDDFSDAVNKAVVIPDLSTMPFRCVNGQTAYNDMQDAFDSERPLYFYADSKCFYITDVAINSINFFPASQFVSASFVNNIFTVTIT